MVSSYSSAPDVTSFMSVFSLIFADLAVYALSSKAFWTEDVCIKWFLDGNFLGKDSAH